MVAHGLAVSVVPPLAATDAIELFDHTFIFSRGRRISFAQRFGDLLASDECFVIAGRLHGQLAGALLARLFDWIDGDRAQRGAMIGLVCTRPEFRGAGCAAALLAAAQQQCRERGCEFAVLWAARHELYGRLGWIAADSGALGIYAAPAEQAWREAARGADDASMMAKIQGLHLDRPPPRVRRDAADYSRVLPPAENLQFFLENRSFAICGQHGRTGYVYDLAAHADDLLQLWRAVAGSFDRIYVNVEAGGPVQQWLQALPGFTWTGQSLAMWKSLRSGATAVRPAYIPFLDRI